jgi:hypothetical protein
VFANHQLSLDTVEGLRSKQLFQKFARQHGVHLSHFHADNNPAFTSAGFRTDIEEQAQSIDYSGVGAKHQNGLAKRTQSVVIEMARSMLQHTRLRWPDEFDKDLWPYALDYAVWLHNHLPRPDTKLSPIKMFAGVTIAAEVIHRARVWGSPCYVLDPKLRDAKKIPKWKVRSVLGQFMGFHPNICQQSAASRIQKRDTLPRSSTSYTMRNSLQ